MDSIEEQDMAVQQECAACGADAGEECRPMCLGVAAAQDEQGCDCWQRNTALGHGGHCCFLRDDRNRRVDDGWRTDDDICHVPNHAR